VPVGLFLYALFFLSGATGLLYQVVWARYLELTLGNTGAAHALVLSVFLGGLAIGNAVFGRRADRVSSSLLLYGWLELFIAVFGLISPKLFQLGGSLYVQTADISWPSGALFGLKALFACLVLLPPTICMGGTLPALTRFCTHRLSELDSTLGSLYFLNSAGAVMGAIGAGFFLIPSLGLDLSVTVAAIANFIISGAVIFIARRRIAEDSAANIHGEEERGEPGQASSTTLAVRYLLPVTVMAVFVSGVISLIYEVAWIRLLALILGSSSYSFSLMLAAFIAGIALGSLAVRLRVLQSYHPLLLFGLAELGVGISVLLTLPLYEYLPHTFLFIRSLLSTTTQAYGIYLAAKFVFCFAIMLLPTFFLGATLPFAAQAVTRAVSEVGSKVGTIYSANTLGNVTGALLGGMVLLPLFGVQSVISSGALVNLLLGMAVILWAVNSVRWLTGAVVLVGSLVLYWYGSQPWDLRVLVSAPYLRPIPVPMVSFAEYQGGFHNQKLLYYEDGVSSSVSVTSYKSGTLVLKVNGKADASTGRDMSTQTLLGHIPALIHPSPKAALIIGLGSGITAGALLKHPIETLSVVEISTAMERAAHYFSAANNDVLNNPRLTLHIDDAKSFLQLNKQKFDLIISEPSNPWIAGIGNVFTREFYKTASARLASKGLMVQWFHTYAMDDRLVQMILRTFSSVFPNVTVWHTLTTDQGMGDFLLIGSHAELSIDIDALARRMALPAVQADLYRLGIASPYTLLGLQILSNTTVDKIKSKGRLNRDRFPLLEYAAPEFVFTGKTSRLLSDADERLLPPSQAHTELSKYWATLSATVRVRIVKELSVFYQKYGDRVLYEKIIWRWNRLMSDSCDRYIATARLKASQARYDEALELFDRVLHCKSVTADQAGYIIHTALTYYNSQPGIFGSGEILDRVRGYLVRYRELGGDEDTYRRLFEQIEVARENSGLP